MSVEIEGSMGSPSAARLLSRPRHTSLGQVKVQSPFQQARRTTAHACNVTLLCAPDANVGNMRSTKNMPSPVVSPRLSRLWSSRSDRDETSSVCSLTPSCIAPSPNTRIRTILQSRNAMKSAPRLSGESFALVSLLFDTLSASSHGVAPSSLPAHMSILDEGDKEGEKDDDDVDLCTVSLPHLIALLQSVAASHLTSNTLGVLDKMFLTQFLCEVYKLKTDLYFGEMISTVATANANVAGLARSGLETSDVQWTCDTVVGLLLATAAAASEQQHSS